MSPPNIKLTYYPVAGRAELTRLSLSYGNIPFEDERINQDEFLKRKPSLPLGQVPVLEVNGKVYSQSIAMARYAAKLSGLYPSDPVAALRVDMIIDTLTEIMNLAVDIGWIEQDPVKKEEKTKKLVDEHLPKSFTALEKLVEGKLFLGNYITLADVNLFDQVTNGLAKNFPQFDTSVYPKLMSIVKEVKSNPNIAAYLAKHPSP